MDKIPSHYCGAYTQGMQYNQTFWGLLNTAKERLDNDKSNCFGNRIHMISLGLRLTVQAIGTAAKAIIDIAIDTPISLVFSLSITGTWESLKDNLKALASGVILAVMLPFLFIAATTFWSKQVVNGLTKTRPEDNALTLKAKQGPTLLALVAANGRVQSLGDEVTRLTAEKNQSTADVARLTAERDGLTTDLDKARKNLDTLNEANHQLTDEKTQVAARFQEVEAKFLDTRKALEEVIARFQQASLEITARDEEIGKRGTTIEGLTAQNAQKDLEIKTAQDALAQVKAELTAASQSLAQTNASMEQKTAQIATIEGTIAQKEAMIQQTASQLQVAESSLAQFKEELVSAGQAYNRAKEELATTQQRLLQVSQESETTQQRLSQVSQELTGTQQALQEFSNENAALSRENSTLAQELQQTKLALAKAGEWEDEDDNSDGTPDAGSPAPIGGTGPQLPPLPPPPQSAPTGGAAPELPPPPNFPPPPAPIEADALAAAAAAAAAAGGNPAKQ